MKKTKKRRMFLLLLAAMMPLLMGARTVWTGTQELDWSTGVTDKYVTVNNATLGTVNVGDYIVLKFSAEASAQIHLNSMASGWPTQASNLFNASDTNWWIKVTDAMTFTNGIAVTGINATLAEIDVEDGSNYTNSVWVGETAIKKDWSNWQSIDKSVFSSAVENHYIRFKFKDLVSGAQFGLQYNNGSSWVTMPGVSNVAISSLYQQYTISSDMLTALQTYGCIVRGGGYTLTAIDIIDPATLKPLTLSVASGATNSNWKYDTTSPTIKITVQNDNSEAVTANAVVYLYTDAYAPYKTANVSQSVAAGTTETLDVSLSDVASGFYRVYATVNDEMAHSAFVIGVNPTSIVSAADKQNDFDAFWQTAKRQLATIEASDEPVLTEITSKSSETRKVYLVEFKSVPDGLTGEPVTVRGYYCEPQDGEKHPVIMHYLGYDSGYRPGGESSTPYCPSGGTSNYAEFYLSTRGQSINNRPAADRTDGIDRDFTNTYGDWFAYNFGDKDAYYYRGAYMDCVRAIDFMASRSTSDMNNLFAEGQSQGGAFTYAAAALSGRTFKAIAPAIPFMGDFPDYFQVGNWPASVAMANQGTMTDSEMYAFLSYFDTKNLATMIKCPVITSIGLQDNVCPPHTNIAPYNNVKTPAADKQIVFNPELAHQVNGSWYTTYNNFFQGYEVDENGEHSMTLWENAEGVAINWNGSSNASITALACSKAKAGDYIQVTLTRTESMQCQLRSGSNYIVNTSNYLTSSGTDIVFRFGLTELGASDVRNSGFYVNGTAFTLKKVELVSTGSTEDFSDAIWYGVRECSWTQIAPQTNVYSSVETGWTLRVHHPTLGTNPKIALYTKDSESKVTPITGYGYASVTGVYTDYTVNDAILTAMQTEGNFAVYGNGLTITKIELFNPTKTLDVETVLYEGTTPLTNWSKNYEQPTSVIISLKAGDVLKVTVSEQGASSTYPQLRICWGTGDTQRISWACYDYDCPHTYELPLTADQVTAIKSAGKLYLNGANITVSKWTLTQQKTVSRERGNAATTIWTGSQAIDWSVKPSTYATVEASAFTNAAAGMKVRMNFSNMKLGAQGRIVKSNWETFADANTYEKLPTAWGDYYEFTLTDDMVTELKANGMHVTGVGFTLTSVELIDPMKEYVINTTFDTDDIKAWEPADGTPNLTVTLTNHETQEVTTTVSASLMTDMFADYSNYSVDVTLDAGETKTIDLPITGLAPGFYRMAAKANNNMLCTYYIGYNPTAIVSPDDSQSDFAEFWGNWKERLAEIPIDAELTLKVAGAAGERNIYEVKYKSVPETVDGDPVYIYGYYAEPVNEGSYPCRINFHGTSKNKAMDIPSKTENPEWCEFFFSARGQTLDWEKNGNEKYRTNPSDAESVDFYAYCLGDNDEHYYRYVYLDTRRAVDFVYSQAKVNKNAVFAVGGSQGGCLTYVCAALSDGRIRAIAPSITGHADFVHTMEIVGWPTNVFNNWINAKVADGTYANYEAGKAALLAHQSYFDTKNFAKWITCPVITNFSLQDQTDGPHLNISPYNLLTNVPAEDKQYSINQFKGHAAADNWGTTYMAFFDNYIANSETTEVAISTAQYGTYYNSKAVLLPSGVKAATIDDAESSALTINWRYDGDDNLKNVIPAATAVLLKGSTGDYDFTLLPHNTDAAPAGNLLKGHDESGLTTGGDKYYKLTYGSAGGAHESVLGWYWGAANGAAFTIGAHKAWLALSSAQARSLSFFALADDDQTTAIGNVSSHPSATPAAVYTLQGQRVHLPHRSATTGDTRSAGLKKGLYIVDGKKIVIK